MSETLYRMPKLLTADDVAAIMQVTRRTAYTYMRKMPHTESPLRVAEDDLAAWIEGRTVAPTAAGKSRPAPVIPFQRRGRASADEWRIPRRRSAAV